MPESGIEQAAGTQERTAPGIVECCTTNVPRSIRAVLREGDVGVVEKPCLQRCGECGQEAYLVVDGAYRGGDSHADLLADLDLNPDSDPEDAGRGVN